MRTLYELIVAAKRARASEVHISPGSAPTFLIHGTPTPSEEPPYTLDGLEMLFQQLLTTAQWKQLKTTGSVEACKWFGQAGEVRASATLQPDTARLDLHLVRTRVA